MKRFSFDRNLTARMVLVRVLRHIAQANVSFDKETGLMIHPPADSPLWIVESLLCHHEKEFEIAQKAKRKARAA